MQRWRQGEVRETGAAEGGVAGGLYRATLGKGGAVGSVGGAWCFFGICCVVGGMLFLQHQGP